MAHSFALDKLPHEMLSQKILESHGSNTRRSSNAAPSVGSGVELPTISRQTRPYVRHAAWPLTEMQITLAERYRRLLITSPVRIFARLVFDLSYFYAIAADFRTRVQYLFSNQDIRFRWARTSVGLEECGEYDSVSRDTRNSRSESEHQNV
jgi:hypothetical protein